MNGTELIIDPLKDYVDLGTVLVAGENEISIKYTTSLANRVSAVYGAELYSDDGLLAVSLEVYTAK